MLRIDRLCTLIIIIGFIFMLPSMIYLSFLDELISFAFFSIAIADCILNGCWRKYKLLLTIVCIITFYAIYSVSFLHYNTPYYILLDWAITLKPFLCFCVIFAISPKFTVTDKTILRIACYVNTFIIVLCFALGPAAVKAVMLHPTYPSQYALITGFFFYYTSIDRQTGQVSKRDLIITIIMLSMGIWGFKAKYFATLVLSIFFMTLYKPGIMRHLNFKHFLIIVSILLLTAAVSWNKFQYYFLTGNSESFDPTVVESFARPVLYTTAGLILLDHFPFGTGLASFATYASQESYSGVYFEYGINNVHGLSPQFPNFICDAFYPSLAQFGFIGLVLFIWFWCYIYGFLRRMIRFKPELYINQFIIGSLIIIFNLIESTGANTLTQTGGMISMCLLGMCCAFGKNITAETSTDCIKNQYKEK